MTPGHPPCRPWTFLCCSLCTLWVILWLGNESSQYALAEGMRWCSGLSSLGLRSSVTCCRRTPRQRDAATINYELQRFTWAIKLLLSCISHPRLVSCVAHRAEDMEVTVPRVVYWHGCLLLNCWPHQTNLSLWFNLRSVPLVSFGEHPARCQW